MTLLQAIILGIVQGITEFLPISSSGHLILGETLLNLEVAELKTFDVVVHVGTLLAILAYFWKDVWQVKRWPLLILGTIPAVIVGLTLEDQIDAVFRSALAVGIVMIVIGAVFMIPESWARSTKDKKLKWWQVVLVGIAQAVAIIPGVSRSGSTIFTGTMLGMRREEAARFSFLLGAVAITGAGILTALDLDGATADWGVLIAGFVASFVAGFLSVKWLMKYLKHHSLKVFGIYLVCIGTITLLAQALLS
jgi:undecaprenyl-diphosphatase